MRYRLLSAASSTTFDASECGDVGGGSGGVGADFGVDEGLGGVGGASPPTMALSAAFNTIIYDQKI